MSYVWNLEDEMMTKIERIARLVRGLTYDEMMEIAEAFSDWTAVDVEGNSQDATIDHATMAANLSGWADCVCVEAEPR